MKVSIQWLCTHAGILRVHPNDDGDIGSPYSWCCSVVPEGNVVHIYGVLFAPSLLEVQLIKEHLRTLGFCEMVWERIKNTRVRTVRIKL